MDLDGRGRKSVHELFEGLDVCLSQTSLGGRGHAVRPVSGVLRTQSFDEGVKDVYGPRWESIVPGRCCSLERCREDATQGRIVVGVKVYLCQEGVQMLVWIGCLVVPLEVEWLPPQGYACLHDAVDKRMSTNSPCCWTVHVGGI